MRVVIADDSLLIRDGLASLLRDAGVDVVAQTASADDLLLKIASYQPDVAIIDIRMPPTHTDEGLRAAEEIRRRYPDVGILILSQHVEVGIATRLLSESAAGIGYLLKDRVTNLEDFTAACGGSLKAARRSTRRSSRNCSRRGAAQTTRSTCSHRASARCSNWSPKAARTKASASGS